MQVNGLQSQFLLVEGALGQKRHNDNRRDGFAQSPLKLVMQAFKNNFSKFLNEKDDLPECCENEEKTVSEV